MAEVKATKAVTSVTLSLTIEEAELVMDALDTLAVDPSAPPGFAMYACALSEEIATAIGDGE